jgi:hypothetical protein
MDLVEQFEEGLYWGAREGSHRVNSVAESVGKFIQAARCHSPFP